ncbi:MAG: WYL domain-containing protein [Nanoarchaeota archaeon]|nr:WYL domain-containing protein [Nanoarchaeota archaeon]
MKNQSNLQKPLDYIKESPKIRILLKKSFNQKRKVKIKYFSLSSDEVKYRVISIYQMHKDCIIAYCHLSGEERTFVIDRILAIALLNEKYNLPGGWTPESIIIDN